MRIIPTETTSPQSDPASLESGPLFELDDVRVVLGGNPALEVDHLALDGGELVGLIGPNGSGKTTLLRLVAGLISAGSGTVRRQSVDVAYVSQHHDHHQWMPLSVHDVLAMGRYGHRGLLGRFGAADRRAIEAAAEKLEVADLRGRGFDSLSGGQRQRVLIASALAAEAPCLLLDEPITGLDLPSQQIIIEAAQAERDAGRLVMMSTHHLDEAAACDRVLVLATEVVADGPPSQALRPAPLQKAFGRRVRVTAAESGGNVLVLDDHGHDHAHADDVAG